MKTLWNDSSMSMRQRLRQVSLGIALLFTLIFIILVVSTNSIPGIVDRIVEERLAQTLQNLKHSRDFGLLDSRVRILHKTFFGDQESLEREGFELAAKLHELEQDVAEPELKGLLAQLRADLQLFVSTAGEISVLLEWRKEQDNKINNQVFARLQQLFEMGGSPRPETVQNDPVEHLIYQVSALRERVLKIRRDNLDEDILALLSVDSEGEYRRLADLRGFSTVLQEMTPFDDAGESFRQQLQPQMQLYREQLLSYYQLMHEQGRRITSMSATSADVLQHMAILEAQSESIAGEARDEIRKIVQTALTSILIVLLATALIFWWIYGKFFTLYFQVPMEKLNQRLGSFEAGDMQTPMQLVSKGEWLEVESGFNRMLVSLQQKVEALTESETRYREIFTNATEAIFRIGLDRTVLEMNPLAVTLLGYDSREDALSFIRDIREQLFLNPDVFDEVIRRVHEQGRISTHETKVKRKDGSEIWVVLNAHLVRDEQGSPLYFEGSARDIESDKLAQEAMRKMQAYLQNIIDSMPSVLIGIDADQRVTLWNEEAARETKVAAVEALEMPLDEVFGLFHLSAYLPEGGALSGQEPIQLLKVETDRGSDGGSKRYFDIVIYPLSTKGFTDSIIHIKDVSERVKLEGMMVRSEKMQSVGSLASGLAHEINNPLAVILQNAQVLSRRFSLELSKNREIALELGTDIETVNSYIEERGVNQIVQAITSAGHRAAKIVENIQSFSRRDMASFTPSNLELLLEQTIELAGSDYDMRKTYNFQKVRIQREYTKIEAIVCEPSQIQQVILTLLKNAAQAMSQEAEEPLLTLRVFPTGDGHACLQIEDNGAGIDEEVAKRIFDPFYTTRDTGSGTGLGLSIAYYIVTQNHNGYLGVRSEPGKGSCFYMLLPFDNAVVAKALMPKSLDPGGL